MLAYICADRKSCKEKRINRAFGHFPLQCIKILRCEIGNVSIGITHGQITCEESANSQISPLMLSSFITKYCRLLQWHIEILRINRFVATISRTQM